MIDLLLIYPKLGTMDRMIVDIPLSIIYVASHSVKRGYVVKVLDLRGKHEDWEKSIKFYLDQGVLSVGISVMTGSPLFYAREISIFVKKYYPATKVIWGGPHPTVLPDTIKESFIDFLIRGYGSVSLENLISCLKLSDNNFSGIDGLSYKSDGKIYHNQRSTEFEILKYEDIPYHLVDVKSAMYKRAYMEKRMFPIFSSIGCPYKCTFCIHPTIYSIINGSKWLPYSSSEVVKHIEYVVNEFGITNICFLDDTSFPDLGRMRQIFQMIINRNINISIEFRGARVNEIDRMDDDFLDLMVKAGSRTLMVGVESGSERILKTMQKGITKEQILRVNRKLAGHPELVPHYNFVYGTPGETYQDAVETKDTVLQLIRDNPKAYFGFGSDWKPIPGSEMLDIAIKEYKFQVPKTLDDWIEIDSLDSKSKIKHSWYTRKHNNMIKLMQISSFVINDGLIRESELNKTVIFKILRVFSQIYKPIALFRLRMNFHQLLIEYTIWRVLVRIITYFKMSDDKI